MQLNKKTQTLFYVSMSLVVYCKRFLTKTLKIGNFFVKFLTHRHNENGWKFCLNWGRLLSLWNTNGGGEGGEGGRNWMCWTSWKCSSFTFLIPPWAFIIFIQRLKFFSDCFRVLQLNYSYQGWLKTNFCNADLNTVGTFWPLKRKWGKGTV